MSDATNRVLRGEIEPVRGVFPERRPELDHHQGFNEAFERAVQAYAKYGTTSGEKLSVTLSVIVSVENPGRIEGYVVDLG